MIDYLAAVDLWLKPISLTRKEGLTWRLEVVSNASIKPPNKNLRLLIHLRIKAVKKMPARSLVGAVSQILPDCLLRSLFTSSCLRGRHLYLLLLCSTNYGSRFGPVRCQVRYDQKGNLIKGISLIRAVTSCRPMKSPENLKNAVIAIEDGRFYKTQREDCPHSVAGALTVIFAESNFRRWLDPLPNTISRTLIFSTDFKDQTLKRKGREAWLATCNWSVVYQGQILTFYQQALLF